MAPIVPFIPLIAAGIGGAASIASSAISSRKANNVQPAPVPMANSATAKVAPIKDPAASTANKIKKPLLFGTGSLGDTTSPFLNRNKLLGN